MIDRSTRSLTKAEQSATSEHLEAVFGSCLPNLPQRLLISLSQRGFLHRGKLRYYFTHLICGLSRPLDIARNGCNYRIEGLNNLIESGLLLHPTYNHAEIDFLKGALGPEAVMVDIGANIGLYSLPLARISARCVAIDANPAMISRLRFNVRASELQNVDIVEAAVGDEEGRADLRIHRGDVAIVNVVSTADGIVQMRPLAAILDDLGIDRVDALKIDIEGYEDKALAPFLLSAPPERLPARIVIERVGPKDYPACSAAFQKLGYAPVGQTRSNSLYART